MGVESIDSLGKAHIVAATLDGLACQTVVELTDEQKSDFCGVCNAIAATCIHRAHSPPPNVQQQPPPLPTHQPASSPPPPSEECASTFCLRFQGFTYHRASRLPQPTIPIRRVHRMASLCGRADASMRARLLSQLSLAAWTSSSATQLHSSDTPYASRYSHNASSSSPPMWLC